MSFLEEIEADLRDYSVLLSEVENAVTTFGTVCNWPHLEPIVDAIQDTSIWLSRAKKALVTTDDKVLRKVNNTKIWRTFYIEDVLWSRYFAKHGRSQEQSDYRFGSRTAQETLYWYNWTHTCLPLPKSPDWVESTTNIYDIGEREGNSELHETNRRPFIPPQSHIRVDLEAPRTWGPEPTLLPLPPSFHSGQVRGHLP